MNALPIGVKKPVRRYEFGNAAFARIKKTSPMFNSGKWESPEAHLLWAIWECAARDHYDMAFARIDRTEAATARRTTKTGLVRERSNGDSVNALEILGIDPDWACRQIECALEYMEKAA